MTNPQEIDWNKVTYFKREEFLSPDNPNEFYIVPELVYNLDFLRKLYGKPIIINSGYRTKKHNEKIGGKEESAHLKGMAVDIKCKTSPERYELLKLALQIGFIRIGIGNTFLHIDIDKAKPQGVIFLYEN